MPNLNNVLFIGGTGTGVGKTWVTGWLAIQAIRQGMRVVVLKWVQTGTADDMSRIRQWCPAVHTHTCYRFPDPFSPHYAAELSDQKIDWGHLLEVTTQFARQFDWVLVEGSGGLLSPLTGYMLFLDAVLEAQMPVVVVSANYVGTLHHTIATVHSAKTALIQGVFLRDTIEIPRHAADENVRYLTHFLQLPIIRVPIFKTEDMMMTTDIGVDFFKTSRL